MQDSGNSPESVAAVNLADKLLDTVFHIIITCNKDGKLYEKYVDCNNGYVLLMPDETNDKSFAMTSSFTSMLLSAKIIFDDELKLEDIASLSKEVRRICTNELAVVKLFNNKLYKRIVCLGSGSIKGIARESALKLLELSGGKYMTSFDSPLGFRHGPKSVVDEETLIIIMVSKAEYTKKYDMDMLKEIAQDTKGSKVVAFLPDEACAKEIGDNIEKIVVNSDDTKDDSLLGLAYLGVVQLLAMETSIILGFSPDNPSPDGFVNRVVQGVTIYEYEN